MVNLPDCIDESDMLVMYHLAFYCMSHCMNNLSANIHQCQMLWQSLMLLHIMALIITQGLLQLYGPSSN